MSSSMHVPVRRFPVDLEELKRMLDRAFLDFGLKVPELVFEPNPSGPGSIETSIILVESDAESNFCWITFGKCPEELTGPDATGMLASVKTRGSWLFAGVVSVGLLQLGGTIVFNDSGELDGRNEYTKANLKDLINRSLKLGELYIRR